MTAVDFKLTFKIMRHADSDYIYKFCKKKLIFKHSRIKTYNMFLLKI